MSAPPAAAAASATGAATQMPIRPMPAAPAHRARRVKRPACQALSGRGPACRCGAGGHPQRTRLLAPQQPVARAAAVHAGSASPDVTTTMRQLTCMARLLQPVPPPWRTGPLARSAAQATPPPPHLSSVNDMKGQRREHACRPPTAMDGCYSSIPSESGRPQQRGARHGVLDGAQHRPECCTRPNPASSGPRASCRPPPMTAAASSRGRLAAQVAVCGNEAHVVRRQARADAPRCRARPAPT